MLSLRIKRGERVSLTYKGEVVDLVVISSGRGFAQLGIFASDDVLINRQRRKRKKPEDQNLDKNEEEINYNR